MPSPRPVSPFFPSGGGYQCSQFFQRKNLDVRRNAVALPARVDHELAHRRQILASGMKATLKLGAEAAFDFNRPQLAAGPNQQQIDFRPTTGTVEITLGLLAGADQQILDDEAFPALPHYGMRKQGFLVGDIQ